MSQENTSISQKSKLTLLILYLIPPFNVWSAYCFYAGKIFYGLIRIVLMLIAGNLIKNDKSSIGLFALGVWIILTMLDFFKIILGKYKDKQGNTISSWNPKKDSENQLRAVLSEVKEFCSLEPKSFTGFEDKISNSKGEFWFPEKYTRCNIVGKNVLQYYYDGQGEILIAVSGDRFLYFSAHIIQNADGKKINHICAIGNDLQKHEKDISLISKDGSNIEFLDSLNSLFPSNENISVILTSYFEKLQIRKEEAESEKQEELKRIQEEEKQKQIREREESARRIEEQKRKEQADAERKAAEEKAYREEHPEEAQAFDDLDSL